MQEKAELSRGIQGKTGCCRAIQDVPKDFRIEQEKADSSRTMQRCTGTYREHRYGKMWDCKTSKMSQSPLAALNAFGLFAAGTCGRQMTSAE
jgi:hypothetical protein